MKNHAILSKKALVRAYTLIEALVGSAVLMIGISAAASLSLSLVTQEEINERSVRALNYQDSAAMLIQLGVPSNQIAGLLPDEPVVNSIAFTSKNLSVTDSGGVAALSLIAQDITIIYSPNAAVASNLSSIDEWTGGKTNVTRNHTVTALLPNQ